MMKNIFGKAVFKIVFLISTSVFALTTAQAADIDAAPVAAKEYDWRGPYFGIQGGGIADGNAVARDLFGNSLSQSFTGGFGGVFGGYNFQSGNVVFGIDNDFSLTSVDEALGGFASVELTTLSTTRLRVGYAFERVLPFVTAGLAYSSVDFRNFEGFTDDQFQFGWTAGAGVEYAATDNIKVRVQYNYIDLGDDDFSFNPLGTFDTVNLELDDIHAIRAGVSIKTAPLWSKVFGR